MNKDMKKTLLFAVLAAAAVSAVSCTKDSFSPAESGPQTFLAGFDDTKVSVEGLSSYWMPGDQIALLNTVTSGSAGATLGALYSTSITAKSATASFTGTGAVKCADSDRYVAFYPASAINPNVKWTTGYVYYMIPHEQIAVKDGFPENATALVADSEGNEFTFKHVNAYLKFTFDETSPSIKEIRISDNAEKNISGAMRVQNKSLNQSVATSYPEDIFSDVILKTSDGSAFQKGSYYVALRATTYGSGLTFSFTNTEGKTGTKSFSVSKALAGGEIADMGTVRNIEFPSFQVTFPEFKYSNSEVFTSFGLTSRYFSIVSTKSWTAKVGSETTASGVAIKTTSGTGNLEKFEVTCGQNTDFANRKKIVIEFTLDGGKIEKVEMEQEKASIIELECRNLENTKGVWPFDCDPIPSSPDNPGSGTLTSCGYSFGYYASKLCCYESSFGWRVGSSANDYITTPAIEGKKLKSIGLVDSNDKVKKITKLDGTAVSFSQNPTSIVKLEETTYTLENPEVNTSYKFIITLSGTMRIFYLKLVYE